MALEITELTDHSAVRQIGFWAYCKNIIIFTYFWSCIIFLYIFDTGLFRIIIY